MIVGSRDDAVNARALVSSDYGGARLAPRPLNNGTFALPAAVLTESDYSAAAAVLADWTITTPAGGDYLTLSDAYLGYQLKIGANTFWHGGRRSSLTMPATEVFRFEVQTNDWADVYDSTNVKRRSELVLVDGDELGVGGGGTVWSAFCLILGDHPGLSQVTSDPQGFVHQWHSVDTNVGRSPGLCVDVSNNAMTIQTRSSAALGGASGFNGVPVTRYSTSVPAKGTKTYFVLQTTFGQTGHLNAWVNGAQVANVNAPIGYYDDLTDGSGRTVLGYPTWGLYAKNQPVTDIVYIANPEWGTTDLSARIASPLAVPDLTW
jgi:hypothetical protein